MTLEEHKEFPVDSASLKEIRNFAREVLAKDEMFSSTKDDVVLAIAEAAQNIVKHAYSGQPTGDTMRVEITFNENTLKIDLFDKGKPVIPQNIKPIPKPTYEKTLTLYHLLHPSPHHNFFDFIFPNI